MRSLLPDVFVDIVEVYLLSKCTLFSTNQKIDHANREAMKTGVELKPFYKYIIVGGKLQIFV